MVAVDWLSRLHMAQGASTDCMLQAVPCWIGPGDSKQVWFSRALHATGLRLACRVSPSNHELDHTAPMRWIHMFYAPTIDLPKCGRGRRKGTPLIPLVVGRRASILSQSCLGVVLQIRGVMLPEGIWERWCMAAEHWCWEPVMGKVVFNSTQSISHQANFLEEVLKLACILLNTLPCCISCFVLADPPVPRNWNQL